MKLIITGASGYVGSEVLRQALAHPSITSVVAVARRSVSLPSDLTAHASKLKSIAIGDYPGSPDGYSAEMRKEFAGAGGCIYTAAITPSRSTLQSWDTVTRVCRDAPMAAMKAIHESGPARPFTFVGMSGDGIPRDQNAQVPPIIGKYAKMRGETETLILDYAAAHPEEIKAVIAKAAIITRPYKVFQKINLLEVIGKTGLIRSVTLAETAATMIDAVLNGAEKDTLENEDLVRIGRRVLASQAS